MTKFRYPSREMLRAHAGPFYRAMAVALSMTVRSESAKCHGVKTCRATVVEVSSDGGRAQHDSSLGEREMSWRQNMPRATWAICVTTHVYASFDLSLFLPSFLRVFVSHRPQCSVLG